MSEVLAGDFDLRVPVVAAVIDSYAKLSQIDVVVELVVSCPKQVYNRLPRHESNMYSSSCYNIKLGGEGEVIRRHGFRPKF